MRRLSAPLSTHNLAESKNARPETQLRNCHYSINTRTTFVLYKTADVQLFYLLWVNDNRVNARGHILFHQETPRCSIFVRVGFSKRRRT